MKKQIDEILMVIDDNACANISEDECDSKDSCAICRAERIYNAGYRKQSVVIDEFVERLKEQPIKCGLPLFGLSTKGEIEAYCNCILLQVRDAIDSIAEAMKGENK